ncbi:LOW QUALITY PROTEIN: HS12B-like protein, partial [Mya arenaria]
MEFIRFHIMLFVLSNPILCAKSPYKIERDMLIEDENSRHLSAKTVFALAIKYHAGIEEKKLTVALEPEAASLFCRHLPIERSGNETSLGKMKAGQRYLVLDAGGGTIDITVHEVMQSMDVKELFKASGGAWGGTKVDEDFKGFINDIAGFDAIADLKQKHLDDFIDLFRRFENKKRSISPDKDSKTVIPLPLSLCSLIEKRQGRALCDLITDTVYASSIGNLEIPLSGSGKDRWVTVRFIFGGTEIDVEATEDSTGKVQHLKIDFLFLADVSLDTKAHQAESDLEKGHKGTSGNPGLRGPPGPYGHPGWPGPPGLFGFPGEIGEKGFPGYDGIPGIIGDVGWAGIQGIAGVPGDVRFYGEAGLMDEPGFQGPEGEMGLKGPNGERGKQGDIGPWGPVESPAP